MMKSKRFALPAIIIVIGLIVAVAAGFFTAMYKNPTITQQDFDYTITYKVNGETKTLVGVYSCRFNGFDSVDDPRARNYVGEHTIDGVTTSSRTYTVIQNDGIELYIVIPFDEHYLMGDTEDDSDVSSLDAPYFEAVDGNGVGYEEDEIRNLFGAEIVDWEYPDPVENTFVFGGFSRLHAESMLVMFLVGLLVLGACLLFVKKDASVSYTPLDRLSALLHFVIGVCVAAFIAVAVAFFPLTMSAETLSYQVFLCVPAFIAFTVAVSVVLRRKGYSKTAFGIQLVGPVAFFGYVFFESVISNLFS